MLTTTITRLLPNFPTNIPAGGITHNAPIAELSSVSPKTKLLRCIALCTAGMREIQVDTTKP